MFEEQKRQLEIQLWGIANLLHGKISVGDYLDYIPNHHRDALFC